MSTPDQLQTTVQSVVFSTLASAHRRLILRELLEGNQPVPHLVQAIAAEEPDREPRRIHAQLHHNHFPKLEAAGFVTVDDGTAALVNEDVIEPYLVLEERFDSSEE